MLTKAIVRDYNGFILFREGIMHTRKQYLIYPPNYKPGDGYFVRYSRYQAFKVMLKIGDGAEVDEVIHVHPARGCDWQSSVGGKSWWFKKEENLQEES